MKKFHLSTVLTITTGRLFAFGGMDEVYAILNYLTGESLFTHQLPRAMDSTLEHVLNQHPELRAAQPPTIMNADDIRPWIESLYPTFGEELDLEPLPAGVYQPMHPMEELSQMRKTK